MSSSIMTCVRVLPASAILILAALVISEGPANAQCPAVGADTGCGTVITITDTGAKVSHTGQGPYDNIEDTLVGMINNSSQPIHAMQLRSAFLIFALDGDGICGADPFTGQPFNPRPPGCPFGPTGYEGPGVSFSDMSPDKTSGTVNFSVGVCVAMEQICAAAHIRSYALFRNM